MPPAGDQVDDEVALEDAQDLELGGIVCTVLDCPGCGVAVLAAVDGAPVTGCADHGGTDDSPAQGPVPAGPDQQPDRSGLDADQSGTDRPGAAIYPIELDDEPDQATVAALVAGQDRPYASRCDRLQAAVRLLDDLRPQQVAERLELDLLDVRAVARWLNGADR